MNIIITAGGTNEKIDQVRKITNMSTGHLGKLICEEFIRQQEPNINEIYYICAKNSLRPKLHDKVNIVLIESVQDLEDAITEIMTDISIDIFVHSMAVSDYTVDYITNMSLITENIINSVRKQIEGNTLTENVLRENIISTLKCDSIKIDNSSKMSSSESDVFIKLEGTKKIISIIKKLQPHTFLIGFKLLENVTKEHLFDVAFNQLRKNHCNLVMANDLCDIKNGEHIGMFVYPEKKFDFYHGKDDIARNLVDIAVKRCNTKHPNSILVSPYSKLESTCVSEFRNIGTQLFNMELLPIVESGTYGNMSIKEKDGLIITGRNVDKGNLDEFKIVRIVEIEDVMEESVFANVYYKGSVKPSIDTAIHHNIYKKTNYEAIIHIHTDRIYAGYPITDYNYPCGTKEEMDSILQMIEENPTVSVIQMYKHGLLIMGSSLKDCFNQIEKLMSDTLYIEKINLNTKYSIMDEWNTHYNEVYNKPHDIINSPNKYYIIGKGINNELGIVYVNIDDKNELKFVLYSSIKYKGHNLGIGTKVVTILNRLAKIYNKTYITVITTEKCNVYKYYTDKLGFIFASNENDDLMRLYKKIN